MKILSFFPVKGKIAEIGVWKGEFSKRLLKIVDPKVLYLVDPWLFNSNYPERMYGGQIAKNQSDMDEIYQEVQETFRNKTNVHVIRSKSNMFFQTLQDNYLDAVYIDGDHSYEEVYNDLLWSYFKVKSTGVIIGDDIRWNDVKDAVEEFCSYKNLIYDIVGGKYIINVR